MKYPVFYENVPPIKLYDPLSDFLGAIEEGIVQIDYIDVVKFAGHSCPTVAGAYIMSLMAINHFSEKGRLVKRGEIKIIAKGPKEGGTNGVTANVAAYICGVNDESGFAGIAGKMNRKNKLVYNDILDCDLEFEYENKSIKLTYDPSPIKADEKLFPLLQKQLKGLASESEQKLFKKLWQNRVKDILLNKDNYQNIMLIKSNKFL